LNNRDYIRDYIWECDYGEHARIVDVLKVLLDEQNASELSMCALFVNNNPYNLEFFIALSYDKPKDGQVDKMLHQMAELGARQRPDIPMKELMAEMGGRRYNSIVVADSFFLETARESLFAYRERSEMAKVISMKPLGKNIPVFLSHASADKTLVEDVIPYLTNQGLPVWYDKISIDYGEGILSAVQSGVRDSGAVLFFVTRSFLHSSWCKLEMEGFLHRYAGGQAILLLTIVNHDVSRDDLPFFLQGIKYLPLKATASPKDIANELLPVLSKHFKH
jgi:TIR domain